MRRPVLLLCALLAAACGDSGGAPSLSYPGPAGHAKWFPLVGTAHDVTAANTTVTCEGCHTDPATFANPQCTTACHSAAATDPIHTGVATYAYTTVDCRRCHPDGSVAAPPDHDTRFFPRGSGSKHAAVACSSCHTNLQAADDPANFACATCHATRPGFSTAHANVTGVDGTTQSPDCLRCHADSQVDAVAAHQARFPIQKGSQTHDTVCLQCHTSTRSDKTFAADFAAFQCTTCHHDKTSTDAAHLSVSNYVYASANCYTCHPTGAGGAPSDHDTRLFPGAFAGSAHHDAGVTCTQCHTDLAHPTSTANFACGTCHLQRDASLVTKHTGGALPVRSSEISTSNSATCLRCHADSQVDTTHPANATTTGGKTIRLIGHQSARCTQCHDLYRSDKSFGADFATDPQATSKVAGRHGCYVCHSSAPPNGD